MSTVLLPNYSKEGREKIAVVESKRNRSPVTAAQLREKGTHTHTEKKKRLQPGTKAHLVALARLLSDA